MPTIKQLIRNAREPIRKVTRSPALRGSLDLGNNDDQDQDQDQDKDRSNLNELKDSVFRQGILLVPMVFDSLRLIVVLIIY